MIIFQDIITGDEMFSDAFKYREIQDGFFYEVEGKTETRKEGFDDSLIGANPSAEEQQEGNDDAVSSGINIVLNHKLVEVHFTKATYKAYVKDYMKSIKAKLQETNPKRVDVFMKDAQAAVKMIMENFMNYQFFIGESSNPDGMTALLDYREDGITPFMLFFKDGLDVVKF
ncbi:translationally-controlled tumor protein homolog [Cynoglossus semilaevis]|uniref:Translationally-controlled tumor protein homolog n=1 Tax=Cynoglossus semilaevis TaxID=244447 RepID=A0A3P8W401_CYNSE|nr:translationally-controlled tumor protein homolog [Cynoglossus semilaevis]